MKFHTYLASGAVLEKRIDAYFNFIEGEYHLEPKPGKDAKEQAPPTQKLWDREPQPATFADLALFLGFNSLKAFEEYLEKGKYADLLKWGHLRIEGLYERKLHGPSAAGAIFALKHIGGNEREDVEAVDNPADKIMKVVIEESGPKPAESEQEVVL